ncbi:hypothetical protein [Ruegeria atlantica]|nr:hypothetical protein [Ruegeria atlantica]
MKLRKADGSLNNLSHQLLYDEWSEGLDEGVKASPSISGYTEW